MQKWEYTACLLSANIEDEGVAEHLAVTGPGLLHAKHTPRALEPALNALGADGWELVTLEPVFAGDNEDILIAPQGRTGWTHTYFAAMKRLRDR